MKYAILKEGFNDDGSYVLQLEQEFESLEPGRVWQTSIAIIYSDKEDNYEDMPEAYRSSVSKATHDSENQKRVNEHLAKIDILTNGTEEQREAIFKDLLLEHRVALKNAGHLDTENKSRLKTITKEEASIDMEEAIRRQKNLIKPKEYKIINHE